MKFFRIILNNYISLKITLLKIEFKDLFNKKIIQLLKSNQINFNAFLKFN